MTLSSHDARLSWTQLGVHMGCTEIPARTSYLDGPAVRAVVNAVFHHRRNQLRMIGAAQLNCGRKLIALEDTLGTGSYLLDLDTEAIYVLAEFSHPLTHQQHRVA